MPNTLPHDTEAERSILGAMLLSKEVCYEVIGSLMPEDFYLDRHRMIYDTMIDIHKKNMPIDITTLTAHLKDKQILDKAGGVEYLLELSESVPTTAHSRYYMRILEDKSMLRKLIKEATSIIEKATGEVDDVGDFVGETEKDLLSVTRDRNSGEFKNIKQVVQNVTDRLMLLSSQGGEISGLKTNYYALDKITSGLQKGDLIILAARPSVGKTAFALNLATNIAYKSKEPVAVFSLEMPAEQLVSRTISSMGGIDSNQIRTGEIIKTNLNRYHAAADRVSQCNLYIDDGAGIKINDIIAKCRRLKQEHGLCLIVIDYLQLITGSGRSDSRQQEVSDISRQLKALARELEVPVIALSQLSRSIEKREDKRPLMSDLRESGAIEQDADIIAFLHREDYQKTEDGQVENAGPVKIIISKHRNGALGEVDLLFEKNFSRFSNIDNRYKEQIEGTKDLRT
ncbi:MAG: replicative DNA helicase [Beduini sp.]|uniref:replicative DNA helicase n=2 Tax=Beduini sp. TaxID=1922300 RepID=UPI0011CCB249